MIGMTFMIISVNYKPFLFLGLLLSVGCNALHKLPGLEKDQPAETNTATTTEITTGVTIAVHQMIQPIRVKDSQVIVEVMLQAGQWVTCNQYEVILDSNGVGGGGVRFMNHVTIVGNQLILTGKEIAPIGTAFRITSTLIN